MSQACSEQRVRVGRCGGGGEALDSVVVEEVQCALVECECEVGGEADTVVAGVLVRAVCYLCDVGGALCNALAATEASGSGGRDAVYDTGQAQVHVAAVAGGAHGRRGRGCHHSGRVCTACCGIAVDQQQAAGVDYPQARRVGLCRLEGLRPAAAHRIRNVAGVREQAAQIVGVECFDAVDVSAVDYVECGGGRVEGRGAEPASAAAGRQCSGAEWAIDVACHVTS